MIDGNKVKIIENILSKGDRVELIPGPNDTVKVIHIKRKNVKGEYLKECCER